MSTQTASLIRRGFAGEVAANVRAEMARYGVTQQQVARVLGLPQSAVSNRSRGLVPWGLDELEVVAPLVRTTASKLCAIRDSNPEPADLEPARIIDLAAARAERAA